MTYPRCQLTDAVCMASLEGTASELDLDGWDLDVRGGVSITGGADGFRFWNGTDADMLGGLIAADGAVTLTGEPGSLLVIDNLDFELDETLGGTASYCDVTDSTVSGSGGVEMDATDDTSTDNGGNVRWDFGQSSSSTSSLSEENSSSSSSSSSLSTSSSTSLSSVSSSSSTSQSSVSSSSSTSQSSVSSSSSTSLSSVSSSSSTSVSSVSSSSSTSLTSLSSSSSSSLSTSSSLSSSSSTSLSSVSSSSSSSTQSGDVTSQSSSQSSTSSIEEVVIPSGFDICAGSVVNSTSMTDIPNLSCTVDVPVGGAYIMAFFAATTQLNNAGESAFYAIDINGTDSTELERYFSASNTAGAVSAVFRSATSLPQGTYTIKGRCRAEVGGTSVTINRGQLVAIAMATTAGNTIPNDYAAVTDTTTSTTLEDIDGLSDTITLANRNHIVGFLAGSTEASTAAKLITIGIDINGEQATTARYHGTANEPGVAGAVLQTLSTAVAGARTSKGIWSMQAGGTATGRFHLGSFGLEDGIDSIDSAFDESGPYSTTSTTLVDITSGITVELNHAAYVFAAMSVEAEGSLPNTQGQFAINIDGVDSEQFLRAFPTANREGNVTMYARSATKVGPGTITVKGRYRTNGGTLTVNDRHLFAMALESTPLIFDSSSSSSSSVSSSSSSSTSLSSQSSVSSSSSSSQSSVSSSSSSSQSSSSSSSQSSSSSTSTQSGSSQSSSSSTSQSSISSFSSVSSSSSSSTSVSSQSSLSSESSSSSSSTSLTSQSSSSTGATLTDVSSESSSSSTSVSSSSSSLSSQSSQSSSSQSTSSSSSIIFHLPSAYRSLASGGISGGSLNDARKEDGSFFSVRETTGTTPGMLIDFDFYEVPNLQDYDLRFVGYYDGSDNNFQVVIQDKISTAHDSLLTLPAGQTLPSTYIIPLPDDPKYVDGGANGTVTIGFYSPDAGDPAHNVHVDLLQLVAAVSSSSSTSTSLSSQSSQSSSSSLSSSSSSQSTSSSQSSSSTSLSSVSSSSSSPISSSSSLSSQSSLSSSSSSTSTSQSSQSSLSSQSSSSSSQTSTSVSSVSSSSSTSISSSSSTTGLNIFPAGATAVKLCVSNGTSTATGPSGASAVAICPTGATAVIPVDTN